MRQLWLFIFVTFSGAAALDGPALDEIEKLALAYANNMGSCIPAPPTYYVKFATALSTVDKFNVISELWKKHEHSEQGGKMRAALLDYLESENGKGWIEHPALEAQITSRLNDENSGMRLAVTELICAVDPDSKRARTLLLKLLSDKDDRLREIALPRVFRLKGGAEIVRAYIASHDHDDRYIESVEKAQSLIRSLRGH